MITLLVVLFSLLGPYHIYMQFTTTYEYPPTSTLFFFFFLRRIYIRSHTQQQQQTQSNSRVFKSITFVQFSPIYRRHTKSSPSKSFRALTSSLVRGPSLVFYFAFRTYHCDLQTHSCTSFNSLNSYHASRPSNQINIFSFAKPKNRFPKIGPVSCPFLFK